MANSAAQFDTLGQTPVQLKAGSGTLYGYDVGNSDASPAMVLFTTRRRRLLTAPIRRSSEFWFLLV